MKQKSLINLRVFINRTQVIRLAMKFESIIVNAQLALLPAMQNKPCIVVEQSDKEGNRKVSILIKLKKGELKRIDICFIPDPLEAILLEEPIR